MKTIICFLLLCAAFPAALRGAPVKSPEPGTCLIYPSPVRGYFAKAAYFMPESGKADILLYHENGDLVARYTESKPSGVQETAMDFFAFHSGVYICRITLRLDSGRRQALKPFKFAVAR